MSRLLAIMVLFGGITAVAGVPIDDPGPSTRKFEIRGDRPFLGGQPIDLWGLRCANALYSDNVTERHVRNLDNLVAHGINLIGVYIQGGNGGWPDVNAGRNGYTPKGELKPEFGRRLEWLVREADKRGMVVMVGLLSPRKDQELMNEAAIERAFENSARFLVARGLRNVFVDLCHEYNADRITSRFDHDILHEPDGPAKKAKLTSWFKAVAPEIPCGICPSFPTPTADIYPGMEVRIIQKGHKLPDTGFIVNVETTREDVYDNDGIFDAAAKERMKATWEAYRKQPNAFLLFHCAYCMGITNKSGTAPNPEMGGYGAGPDDRGMRFYFDWVRDNIGPYQYPRHAKGR